jgi:hypothetical protein
VECSGDNNGIRRIYTSLEQLIWHIGIEKNPHWNRKSSLTILEAILRLTFMNPK